MRTINTTSNSELSNISRDPIGFVRDYVGDPATELGEIVALVVADDGGEDTAAAIKVRVYDLIERALEGEA